MGCRVRPTISDEQLLEMLRDGVLVVDLEAPNVYKRGVTLSIGIAGKAGCNGTRQRVEICENGGKRSVLLCKMVYMAGSLSLIPAGYEVHHLDENRYNDRYSNLVLLTVEDHRKIHGTYVPVESSYVPF